MVNLLHAVDTSRMPAARFNEIKDLRECTHAAVSANADARRGDATAARAGQQCALSANADRLAATCLRRPA
jgi:hypothetical protein